MVMSAEIVSSDNVRTPVIHFPLLPGGSNQLRYSPPLPRNKRNPSLNTPPRQKPNTPLRIRPTHTLICISPLFMQVWVAM